MTLLSLFESLPNRFRADKAGDYQGVFHFDFDTEKFTVHILHGKCTTEPGLHDTPKCTIKATSETYLSIESGTLNPQTAMLSGQLQIDNLQEMLHFSKLFRPLTKTENPQAQKSRKPTSGALLGLKIIDFTRLLPGPLATMLLADMGAEVIKVESPTFKDYARDFPPFLGGESAAYLAFNRSKRSLCIDYTAEEGKKTILDLVKTADIFIEQFRPGVMAKMGLGYEDLKKINPRLIYVSITGYGQSGPYAQLAGHDLNYITYAGVLAGNQLSAPQMPNIQIADIAGGSYMAVIACLSAIYARERTGTGQWVDVAMLDCVMPLTVNAAAMYWATGENAPKDLGYLSGGLVNYGIYPCQDRRYIALGTLEVKFWEQFCDAVDKPEWKGRVLAKNQEELAHFKQELTALFQTQPSTYWIEIGLKHDLLLNLVYDLPEVEQDAHIQAREMIVAMTHPTAGKIKSIGVPLKFSGTPAKPQWYPPLLGEDTLAILQEAGVSEQTIQELKQKGLLKG
jgi:crotonobetainyl-CoA:carnitine CoA-transferase CaiB-like acyl-CoA transferase